MIERVTWFTFQFLQSQEIVFVFAKLAITTYSVPANREPQTTDALSLFYLMLI